MPSGFLKLTSIFLCFFYKDTNRALSSTNYVQQVKAIKISNKYLSYHRETARALKSVEILPAAAQLYEKSYLTRRIALSCGIKISPVSSLD